MTYTETIPEQSTSEADRETLLLQSLHFHADFSAELLNLDAGSVAGALDQLAEWYADPLAFHPYHPPISIPEQSTSEADRETLPCSRKKCRRLKSQLLQSLHFHADFCAKILNLDAGSVAGALHQLAEWYADPLAFQAQRFAPARPLTEDD